MSLSNLPRVQQARIAEVLKNWPATQALKFSLACRFASALGFAHGTHDRVHFLEHVMGRRRFHDVEGCPTCESITDGFGPPHDASVRCESGGHTHCTCDTCF